MEIIMIVSFPSILLGIFLSTIALKKLWKIIDCDLRCASVLIKCGAVKEKNKFHILFKIIEDFILWCDFLFIGICWNFFDLFLAVLTMVIERSTAIVRYEIFGIAMFIQSFAPIVIILFMIPSIKRAYPYMVGSYIKSVSAFISPTIKFSNAEFGRKRTLIYQSVIELLPTTEGINVVEEQKEASSETETNKLDYAYVRLKKYADGHCDDIAAQRHADLFKQNILYIIFCLGWCIFHADTEKKDDVTNLKQKCFEKFRVLSGWKSEDAEPLIKMSDEALDDISEELLLLKKDSVDPEYLKDSSKENYNRLLKQFLETICERYDIEWYDGIFEDFKYCMDE